MQEYSLKFRSIKPRSPHLNGKVERSHQMNLQEFYVAANLKVPNLNGRMEERQFHYNWYWQHSSLKGKTPMNIVCSKSALTSFWEDVEAKYDSVKEPIREQSYRKDRNLLSLEKKPYFLKLEQISILKVIKL
ncbi:integrase core domain-containing protein [Adhaeribacter arboris]|uniref:integrase core domain-containing protein n=1 Tax=Adhaeribacter arboris TaxID=2072846 RepID=UPI001304CF27|nr:integrase core domain-containing protein [Adhaeribacter arboris]